MIRQRHSSLLLAIGALVTFTSLTALPPSSAAPYTSLRRLGLGKWADGRPTEIDCSASSHDYEYYIERCIDTITQWWINGRCINGVKEEVSELHRCMKPDGSRTYCHDCNDGKGNIKNICGSDNPDKEEMCRIAWSGTAEDCGEEGLTVYAHQCLAERGESDSWYLREDFDCYEKEVYLNGPCMEAVPPRTEFTCGDAWYYPYAEEELSLMKINPEWTDLEHPFATPSNRYCLDCGLAIQVCHGGEAETTCEDLGLPAKGIDSCELCGMEGVGAAGIAESPEDVAPDDFNQDEQDGVSNVSWEEMPDNADSTQDNTQDETTDASEDETESAPASDPSPSEPSSTASTESSSDESTAAGPSDPVPGVVDSAQTASSSACFHRSWSLIAAGALVVVGESSSAFI